MEGVSDNAIRQSDPTPPFDMASETAIVPFSAAADPLPDAETAL
jgi:hypothetical protein